MPQCHNRINAGGSQCRIYAGSQAYDCRKDDRSHAKPPWKAEIVRIWDRLFGQKVIGDSIDHYAHC